MTRTARTERQAWRRAAAGLAALLAGCSTGGVPNNPPADTVTKSEIQEPSRMISSNEQTLKEAAGFAAEFEKTLEADRLEEAAQALENVRLDAEPKDDRPAVRAATLARWLDLLVLLDTHLDPKFDPEDVPPKTVEPPEVPGGVTLRPGAPPSAVSDPAARADYEKAIAEHRDRVRGYRLQVYLQRLNESLPASVAAFVKGAYRKNDADRAELGAALEQKKVSPGRRAALEKILAP